MINCLTIAYFDTSRLESAKFSRIREGMYSLPIWREGAIRALVSPGKHAVCTIRSTVHACNFVRVCVCVSDNTRSLACANLNCAPRL